MIVSRDYDGQLRKLYPAICEKCSVVFLQPKHTDRKYCSTKCFSETRKRQVKSVCAQCGQEFERAESKANNSKHKIYFCSRECKDIGQSLAGKCPAIRPHHYGDGLSTYRDRAIKQYGVRCNRCGYNTHEQMLDVHHKDEDRENGSIENLEVLCVWCHALDTRLGVVAQLGERLPCTQEAVGS